MKRKTIWTVAAVLIMGMATACGGGHKQPAATPEIEGVSARNAADGVTLYGIADRDGEQSADLFKGQDDSLLYSLLDEGQTAFRSAFNAYLAVSEAHTVLFDAGLGPQAGGQLLPRMEACGITAAQVEAVCLTHLHGDHLGTLVDNGQAVFPQAVLYLSQAEYEAWADNEKWQQVLKAYDGKVHPFADSAALCDGLVQSMPAYGHTPGHTVYRVGNCLVVGDLLHAQDLQLDHPDFCARYDADPIAARAQRKHYYDYCRQQDLWLCGAHCHEPFIKL